MSTDKREHILTEAEKLFAEKGFDGTSVRDIAHNAGVNLAMISYYFGSKEKLLESLIELRAGYTIGILEELNKDQTLSPWDKIERLVEYYVNKIITNIPFHNIMHQQALNARSVEIKDLIMSIKLRNVEQVRKIFTDGLQKGVFRQVDIEMTMGSIMGTISQYTISRDFGCRVLHIEQTNEETYRAELAIRLKAHLKQLLKAHLGIKDGEK
ncbi:MAG: TetR family transcriptional regulator [Puia sp.]|nr:TetR family transcriptional regulator [Puia sp.]